MRALMSAPLPLPSMMVVFSFSTTIFLASPRSLTRRLLERQADFVGDHGAAREGGDVLQHGLAAIAEARGLHGRDLDDATDVVHHQGRERLAFDVFSDDEQRTTGLRHAFEERQHFADVGDLLVDQEDVAGCRARPSGSAWLLMKYARQVAAVELHAFDDIQLVVEARALFNRDHAFLADLLHRVGNGLADRLVGVRGDRADLRDGLLSPCRAWRASSALRRPR